LIIKKKGGEKKEKEEIIQAIYILVGPVCQNDEMAVLLCSFVLLLICILFSREKKRKWNGC